MDPELYWDYMDDVWAGQEAFTYKLADFIGVNGSWYNESCVDSVSAGKIAANAIDGRKDKEFSQVFQYQGGGGGGSSGSSSGTCRQVSYDCGAWRSCINSKQSRDCIQKVSCGSKITQKVIAERQDCVMPKYTESVSSENEGDGGSIELVKADGLSTTGSNAADGPDVDAAEKEKTGGSGEMLTGFAVSGLGGVDQNVMYWVIVVVAVAALGLIIFRWDKIKRIMGPGSLVGMMLIIAMPGVMSYSFVTGTVYSDVQAKGNELEGASVHASCNGYLSNTAESLGEAGSEGDYLVWFNDGECPDGSDVTVTAESEDSSGTASGVMSGSVTGISVAVVNVFIPEFSFITAGVAGLGGIAGYAFLRRRRK